MKLLALSAALVLGLVVWWCAPEHGTRTPPVTGAAPRRVEPVVEMPRLAEQHAVAPPRIDRPADPVPQAIEAEPENVVAEQRTHLQARFTDQHVDPAWASAARQALSEDLARFSGQDVRVQGVECRSSLCRAELVLTSPEAGRSFMESWLRQRTWTGPGFVATDDAGRGGDPTMIVFLGRPGTQLPFLE